jgi:hypothetical protein
MSLTTVLVSQVIHLGKHQLCDTWDEPQHLYEVMPTMLAERKFGKPRTMRRVEMGYREAPEAGTPMVVVFVKVRCLLQLQQQACPPAVLEASRAGPRVCLQLQACAVLHADDHEL